MAVALGGCHERLPRLLRPADLYAVCAGVKPEEQVAVPQLGTAPVRRVLLRLHDLGDERVLHRVAAEHDHVVGGRVVARGIEAVRIGEVGVLQAQVARLGVHAVDERRDVAGDVAGNGDRGVGARGQEEAIQQVAHRKRHARLQSHHRAIAGEEAIDVDGHHIVRIGRLGRHNRRHDLRDAGRRQTVVGVLRVEQVVAVVGDDSGGDGSEVGRTRFAGRKHFLSRRGRRRRYRRWRSQRYRRAAAAGAASGTFGHEERVEGENGGQDDYYRQDGDRRITAPALTPLNHWL